MGLRAAGRRAENAISCASNRAAARWGVFACSDSEGAHVDVRRTHRSHVAEFRADARPAAGPPILGLRFPDRQRRSARAMV